MADTATPDQWQRRVKSVRLAQHTHTHTHNQMSGQSCRCRNSPDSAERLGHPLRSGSGDRGRRTDPSPPHTLDCGSWFWCRLFSGGIGGRWIPENEKINCIFSGKSVTNAANLCSVTVNVGLTVELLYTFSRTLWQMFCSSDSVMSSTGRTTWGMALAPLKERRRGCAWHKWVS